MKSIAYILLACLMFLSSVQGIGNTTQSKSMADCCKGATCKHGKPEQKEKGCDSKACNRMVSCTRCGFIVTEQLTLTNQYVLNKVKSNPIFDMDIVSGFTQIGWHPPKA
ncbi:MAG: hypothetical protein EOP45_09440 [Sphingobacteriaceae bacterium]|nr:MAG: hypothetical protein EOP45_09440 [Sphingobacteriaceae bacterium]